MRRRWNFPSIDMNNVDKWVPRRVRVSYFRSNRAVTISLNFAESLRNMTIDRAYVEERLEIRMTDVDTPFQIYMVRVNESTVTFRIRSSVGMPFAFKRRTPIEITSKKTSKKLMIKDYDFKDVK